MTADGAGAKRRDHPVKDGLRRQCPGGVVDQHGFGTAGRSAAIAARTESARFAPPSTTVTTGTWTP